MAFGDIKGTKTGTATSITASLACATGTNFAVVAGDLIVATLAEQDTLTVTACTDNLTNTYTPLTAGADAGTVTGRTFYSRVTNAGTISSVTFTATASANNCVGLAVGFEGPFVVSPLDRNPASIINDNTTPYACPPTGVLAQANEKIVCVLVHNGNPTLTATSPNAIAVQLNSATVLKAAIGHQTVSATTSVTPAFTSSATPTASFYDTASFKRAAVVHTTLPAATGSFALAGQAATFALRRRITLDPAKTSSLITLSGGNLTATRTSAGSSYFVSSLSFESGTSSALYAEATISVTGDSSVGVSNSAIADGDAGGTTGWTGVDANSIGLFGGGRVYYNGVDVGGLPNTIDAGDVIGVFFDTAGQQVWFRNVTKGESWSPSAGAGYPVTLGAGPYYFGFSLDATGVGTANFDGPFAGDPESATKWDGTPITTVTVTHYTLTAVTGALTLTGVAANTQYARKLIAAAGAFTLTGVAAGTGYARKLIAVTGTFLLSGKATVLRTTQVLSAQTLPISVTGVAAVLKHRRMYIMAATVGAVVLTGLAAALSKAGAVVLLAAKGALNLIGVDAALFVVSAPITHYTLAALPGMFVMSGQAAALNVGRVPPVPQFEILQFGRPVYHMPGRW